VIGAISGVGSSQVGELLSEELPALRSPEMIRIVSLEFNVQ